MQHSVLYTQPTRIRMSNKNHSSTLPGDTDEGNDHPGGRANLVHRATRHLQMLRRRHDQSMAAHPLSWGVYAAGCPCHKAYVARIKQLLSHQRRSHGTNTPGGAGRATPSDSFLTEPTGVVC